MLVSANDPVSKGMSKLSHCMTAHQLVWNFPKQQHGSNAGCLVVGLTLHCQKHSVVDISVLIAEQLKPALQLGILVLKGSGSIASHLSELL